MRRLGIALVGVGRARGLRPDAPICRRPIRAAAGRLQIARHAPRRQRRVGHHRRPGRAARRLDRDRAGQSARRACARSRRSAAAMSSSSTAAIRCPASAPRRSPSSSGSTTRSAIRSRSTNISGAYLPTKRGKGLDWTLGEDAVALGQRTGMDYALVPPCRGQLRLDRAGRAAGARRRRLLRRLLRAQHRRRRAVRLCQPGRPAHRRGGLVQRRSRPAARSPGSRWATSAPTQGAAQMVERLLGRMKPGRDVRRAQRAEQ